MALSKTLHLLIVEDSEDDYRLLLREVERGGYAVVSSRITTMPELAAALDRRWDLMITEWMLPRISAAAALEAVRGHDLPCIVIAGAPNEGDAIAAIHAG